MNLPIRKAIHTLRKEGLTVFLQKTANYIKKHRTDHPLPKSNCLVDVLFVNGCSLPHPYRYRVKHQMEQLASFGMEVDEIWYEDLTMEHIPLFKCVIVYRCPCTPLIEDFIKKARYFNKTVLFDIDDLVIDTKYTDTIPFVSRMDPADKASYDDGVNGYRKTMQLCDAVICTTEGMAKELASYMPEVFINRNSVSEQMIALSDEVLKNPPKKGADKIVLGYFSGSITHNDDYAMIMPVLIRLMNRYPQIELLVVGELDLPDELKPFKGRIKIGPFVDWTALPELIARADINLVPLLPGVFDEAKSENKWAEAALVKVPTVASNIGAFHHAIEDGKTGILVDNDEESWEKALERLVLDGDLRKELAENAHNLVHGQHTTMSTGLGLRNFIQSHLQPSAVMVFPSFDISGGVIVALRHYEILRENGWNITAVNVDTRPEAPDSIQCDGLEILAVHAGKTPIVAHFDYGIATMWFTVNNLQNIKCGKNFYLVQNFEPGFYPRNTLDRLMANSTYCRRDIAYVTISRWCQDWLQDTFGQDSAYAPNGLERDKFYAAVRDWRGKIRVLIEGDSESEYKNVDESFKIVKLLPEDRFEVWYVSYNGKAKSWYRVDKFLHRVPHEEMPDVYRECHILLKTSILESFSYPPLEMMATGGFVVVRENEGNKEYLVDGENCRFYDPQDLSTAKRIIEEITADEKLRKVLYDGGMKTAAARDWKSCEKEILALYQ